MDDGEGERLAYWPRTWAARATGVLIAGLEDGRRRVREAAVLALERVGTVEAIGALLPMVADPRGVGRERVEPAIGRIDARS